MNKLYEKVFKYFYKACREISVIHSFLRFKINNDVNYDNRPFFEAPNI
jgi:hypothetical protein